MTEGYPISGRKKYKLTSIFGIIMNVAVVEKKPFAFIPCLIAIEEVMG